MIFLYVCIVHHHYIDHHIAFRLSGISNNAVIEIIKKASSSSQSKTAATLGLQLPDGTRLKGVFPLDLSLWSALRRFEKKEDLNLTRVVDEKTQKYSIPSLSALNQHVKSLAELKSMKLSDMGLRDNSNLLLRLTFIASENTLEELKDLIEDSDDDYVPKKKVKSEASSSEVEPSSENAMQDETPSEPVTTGASSSSETTTTETTDVMEEEEEEIKLENTVATNIRLYKKGDTSFDIDFSNVEEKDFDLSENDLQSMISGLRKVQEGNALMTKEYREKEQLKKERKYDSAIVRVRFPEGYIAQGTFKPEHTINDIKNFVIQTLDDPKTPIYLYIAPPIQRFDDLTKTLKEANLVPASIVNVGLDRKDPTSASFENPKLKPDLLHHVTELELVSVPKNQNVQTPVTSSTAKKTATTGGKSKALNSLMKALNKK